MFGPQSYEDERLPLVYKPPSRGWTRIGLVMAAALGIAGTLCVVPFAARAAFRRHETSAVEKTNRSRFCIAQAAYGDEYVSMAAVTSVSKQRYAALHGYRYLEYAASSLDDFVDKYCPELAGQIALAYSKTTPVKSCGIWAALRDSCDYVLWTDADAVLVDSSIRLEDLMYLDDASQADGLAGRDVLFFLEAYKKLGLCSSLSAPNLPPGYCGTVDDFANCVNTGALIVKSGAFAETLIRDQLAMAVFDNDFLLHSPCATDSLGSGLARNITWDQCMFQGETEQCTLSCLYRNNPTLLDSTVCRISDDNNTHYLFGTLLDPPEEALTSFENEVGVDASNVSAMELYDGHHDPPHPYDGTFIYNCMGGNFEQKMKCVTFATYSLWPDMLNDDATAPARPRDSQVGILPEVYDEEPAPARGGFASAAQPPSASSRQQGHEGWQHPASHPAS